MKSCLLPRPGKLLPIMKRIFRVIIPLLLLSLFSLITIKIIEKVNTKKITAERIQKLPDFNLKTIDGSDFTKTHLSKKLPIVLIYFHSTCEYCQDEAQQISDNFKAFDRSQLIFVSNEKPNVIRKFAEDYDLSKHDNIKFLSDSDGLFATTVGANTTPYLLIYNSDFDLKVRHKGSINISKLITLIKS